MRFFIVFFALNVLCAHAQVTVQITSLPGTTPPNPVLFIAGSFNQWNPADSAFMFTKAGPNYEVVLPPQNGVVKFKVTRGSWQTCEGTVNGGQIADRSFTYTQGLIMPIQIAGWEATPSTASTALPNVKVVSDVFFIPQLNRTRKVSIYLPNNYDSNSTERYPVLYMHDGQNLFDEASSFSGEWGVDETLSAREKSGRKSCIVVAIDNGGVSRLEEYAAFANPQYGGGRGEPYVSFLVNTLKPFIDSAYRTLPQRDFTAIAGSSMGGLISMYAAIAYPEVYSKVGLFSPSFWFSDSLFTYVASKPKTADTRFYIVAGINESETMVRYIDSMIVLLNANGHSNAHILKSLKADGAHREWFWKREFGPCYDWLFSDWNTGLRSQKVNTESDIMIYPNPAKDSFSITPGDAISIQLIDKKGKVLHTWNHVKANTPVSINKYKAGHYILKIRTQHTSTQTKFVIE